MREPKLAFGPDLVKLIAEIDEFKGRWDALKTLSPDRLSALRKVATIESVGSSTRIEGAKRERQATAALRRKHVQRRSGRTVVQGSPQPTRCVRTEFEVAVKLKFDRIGFGDDWCFLQP